MLTDVHSHMHINIVQTYGRVACVVHVGGKGIHGGKSTNAKFYLCCSGREMRCIMVVEYHKTTPHVGYMKNMEIFPIMKSSLVIQLESTPSNYLITF